MELLIGLHSNFTVKYYIRMELLAVTKAQAHFTIILSDSSLVTDYHFHPSLPFLSKAYLSKAYYIGWWWTKMTNALAYFSTAGILEISIREKKKWMKQESMG